MAYKVKGGAAQLNFELSAEERARLDGTTLEQLLQSFRDQAAVFSRGKSVFRGVAWHERSQKWQARIKENGSERSLGYHATEEEAARAYDDAARRIHGT